jgi:hypothetical protein
MNARHLICPKGHNIGSGSDEIVSNIGEQKNKN